MPHVRRQIREAIGTALLGLPTTASRVYQSRTLGLGREDLPCLLIYTRSEDVDVASKGRDQARALELVIEGVAKQTDDLDDKLDAMAEEVEVAIEGAGRLGGLAQSVELTRSEIGSDEETQVRIGSDAGTVRLVYSVQYATAAGDPTTVT